MTPRKQAAYRIFTEHLEARISSGSYRPGEKLPSLEQFIKETNLSSYAVQKGMKYLQAKGLIELRHGSGTYVSKNRSQNGSPNGWNITIFCNAESRELGKSYLSHALLGAQNLALKHLCNLTLRPRNYYENVKSPLSTAAGDTDGILLLGEYDYRKLELPASLPTVGVDMADCAGGVLSTVLLDPLEAARLATDFFLRRGQRKVKAFAYLDIPFVQQQLDAFRLHFAPHGEIEILRTPIGDPGTGFAASPDTGVLFFGGHQCEIYQNAYFKRHGEKMTGRFDVLSIDGKSLIVPDYQPVSTVWIDWKEAGEAAFSELLRRLENPGSSARRILIIPQIREIGKS